MQRRPRRPPQPTTLSEHYFFDYKMPENYVPEINDEVITISVSFFRMLMTELDISIECIYIAVGFKTLTFTSFTVLDHKYILISKINYRNAYSRLI